MSPRVAAALVVLLLAGCGEEPVVVDARTVTRIELRGCADPIDAGAACLLQNVQFNAAGEQVIEQPLSWRSDNPAIATVQPGGRVTGVSDGATTIHATVGTAATSAAVVVRSSVAVVRLAGCTTVLLPGGTGCTMTASAYSTLQRLLPDRVVTWQVGDPEVAAVDAAGHVSPIARGHARIRATIEGVSADTLVAVGTPVYRVAVEGCEGVLAPASSCQLQVRTTAADGQVVVGGAPEWESSDSATVGIDPTGMVAARRLGVAQATVRVDGVEAAVSLEVGGFSRVVLGSGQYGCGFKPDGRIFCWGRNSHGQLGDGTFGDRPSPVLAIGGAQIQDLAIGSEHACGITPTLRLLCWGGNENGQLGDGSHAARSTAREVEGGLSFRAVATGWRHTCALATDGSTYCWGGNVSGESGQPFPSGDVPTPRPIPGQLQLVSLVAGSYHTCGLDDSGRAWCWGSGGEGQLGQGELLSSFEPVVVLGGLRFVQLIAGAASTCGLSTVQELYCWGRNSFGQAGNGTTTLSTVPVRATGLPRLQRLFGAAEHVCALDADGALLCWGRNDLGQLGDGTTMPRPVPVVVGTSDTYADAAAGASQTCGLRTSGAFECWGALVPIPPYP